MRSSLTSVVAPSSRLGLDSPTSLDFSLLIGLEYIDALGNDLLAFLASAASRQYGCELVAGWEDMICGHVDLFKRSEHRDQKLSQMKKRESVERAPALAILQVHRMTVSGRVEE